MWLPNYGYRKKITLDLADSDLTDFPVYVRINDDADIGGVCRSDGYDVRFVDRQGNELTFERLEFGVTGGLAQGHFFVKCDVSSTTATEIYCFYGYASATNVSSSGAWASHYLAVYHLNNSMADATGNGNTMTDNGTDDVAGRNGLRCREFVSANSDYLLTPTIDISGDAGITGLMLVTDVTKDSCFFENGAGGGWQMWFDDDTTDSFRGAVMSPVVAKQGDISNPAIDTWYHLGAVTDASPADTNFFENGAVFSVGGVSDSESENEDIAFGAWDPTGAPSKWGDCKLQELRVSNQEHNPGWINFEYHNLLDGDNALTWGDHRAVYCADFTTWTEHGDASNILTQTTPLAQALNIHSNYECALYRDFGAGFFGDFVVEFKMKVYGASTSSYMQSFPFAVSNDIDTGNELDDGMRLANYSNIGSSTWTLNCHEIGGASDTYVASYGTQYWCIFERSSTTATLKIYDSTKTTLIDTLTFTVGTTTYQYLLVTLGSVGGSDSRNHDVDIEELTVVTDPSTNVTVTPTVLSASGVLNAPTVTGIENTTFSATVLSASGVLNAPTISTGTNVTVSATVLSATSVLPTPSISGTALITLSTLIVDAVLNDPTVTGIENALVTPTVLSAIAGLQTPGVSIDVLIQASVEVAGLVLNNPSISTSGAVTVVATALQLVSSLGTSTVTIDQVVQVAAHVIDAVLNDPTIDISGSVTVTPSVQELISSIQAPLVSGGCLITVSAQTMEVVLNSITVALTSGALVVTTVQSLTSSVNAPTFIIGTTVEVSALVAVIEALDPTVSIGTVDSIYELKSLIQLALSEGSKVTKDINATTQFSKE